MGIEQQTPNTNRAATLVIVISFLSLPAYQTWAATFTTAIDGLEGSELSLDNPDLSFPANLTLETLAADMTLLDVTSSQDKLSRQSLAQQPDRVKSQPQAISLASIIGTLKQIQLSSKGKTGTIAVPTLAQIDPAYVFQDVYDFGVGSTFRRPARPTSVVFTVNSTAPKTFSSVQPRKIEPLGISTVNPLGLPVYTMALNAVNVPQRSRPTPTTAANVSAPSPQAAPVPRSAGVNLLVNPLNALPYNTQPAVPSQDLPSQVSVGLDGNPAELIAQLDGFGSSQLPANLPLLPSSTSPAGDLNATVGNSPAPVNAPAPAFSSQIREQVEAQQSDRAQKYQELSEQTQKRVQEEQKRQKEIQEKLQEQRREQQEKLIEQYREQQKKLQEQYKKQIQQQQQQQKKLQQQLQQQSKQQSPNFSQQLARPRLF
jgi:translation initiation factor 2B subunit (eIF-2B alpha/beta/delta family)